MDMKSEDYIFETGFPCVYCGSTEAEVYFNDDGPPIFDIMCNKCNCFLPRYDTDKFMKFMENIIKEHWKKIMDIKKREIKTVKILIVFDEKGISKVIKNILDDFDVTIVSSSLEAEKLIRQKTFNLFIVSFQMPELNGIELLELIKEEYKNEPHINIFSTAYGTIHLFSKEIGQRLFSFYLEAPFNLEDAKNIFNKAIIELKKRNVGNNMTKIMDMKRKTKIMDIKGKNYFFETGFPCVCCGNTKARVYFYDAGIPLFNIWCDNCNYLLSPYDDKIKFLEFMKDLTEQYWEKFMNNSEMKAGNCPYCNQDWNLKDNIEINFEEEPSIKEYVGFIVCLKCHGISPHVKVSKEEILKLRNSEDYKEVLKNKIIKIALTKDKTYISYQPDSYALDFK